LHILAEKRQKQHDYCVDSLDWAILDELMQDGRISNQDLAERVGLTPAPCLRRVRKLEAEGVIVGYRAVVNPTAVDRGHEVIVHANLQGKTVADVEAFEAQVASMEEVVEFRRMYGRPDYLIRVRVADSKAYETWLTTRLYSAPGVAEVDSRLTMKLIKGAG
jgi:DNA-binding Lrp family transcriptional regulator